MTTATAKEITATAAANATVANAADTWAAISALEWRLEAWEGKRFQYYCPELTDVEAHLVVEFTDLVGENEISEIDFAYYVDNTGIEWCYPSEC